MTGRPIIITGCARSGTSFTAGLIHGAGVFGGNTLAGPTPFNRKGMFENTLIRDGMVKPLLRGWGTDPKCQFPLPTDDMIHEASPSITGWRDSVLNVLVKDGMRANQRWFYKGAKAVLMWPVWVRAFPEAQWVWVRRDTEQIVRSCLRTPFMSNVQTDYGWREWVAAHLNRLAELKRAADVFEYRPATLIGGDTGMTREMFEWLGLPFSEEDALAWVDPSLWNEGKKEEVPVNG